MARQLSIPQGFSRLDTNYKVIGAIRRPTPSARKKKEELERIHEENQVMKKHPIHIYFKR